MRTIGRSLVALVLLSTFVTPTVYGQGRGGQNTAELRARRDSLEKELESIAVIDRKVMVPMRDGARMATDVYRPKNTAGKVSIVFVRTPRNSTPSNVATPMWG